MSLKKKLGLGIMTGALGLSLIGGGTWAAFNDVETLNNTFASGTLDLVVGENTTVDFEISNLKPGDYFNETLVLENNGSLDINQILVHATKEEGWIDRDVLDLNSIIGAGAGENTEDDFLSQFQIEIKNGATILFTGTLADLVAGLGVSEITGTDDQTVGLPVDNLITYDIYIEFVEDPTLFPDSRLHVQNKYQGEMSNLQFVFEATQMPGEDRSND